MNSKEKLLEVTFMEIYENGYSATSVDKILKKANMNKGSMYHFFKSKKALTIAMIEENLSIYMRNKYEPLLTHKENIIDEIIKRFKNRKGFDFVHGCKLNNLVQELSPIDKDFKNALEKVYINFESVFEEALTNAIKAGEIKHDNPKVLAMFIVASFEGCLGTAKKSQDGEVFQTCISQLDLFLQSLKI